MEEDTRCCFLMKQTHLSRLHSHMTRGPPVRRSRDPLTCAVGASLAGGIDGFLADFALRLKPAVPAACTVPVTENRQWLRTWSGPACGCSLLKDPKVVTEVQEE